MAKTHKTQQICSLVRNAGILWCWNCDREYRWDYRFKSKKDFSKVCIPVRVVAFAYLVTSPNVPDFCQELLYRAFAVYHENALSIVQRVSIKIDRKQL